MERVYSPTMHLRDGPKVDACDGNVNGPNLSDIQQNSRYSLRESAAQKAQPGSSIVLGRFRPLGSIMIPALRLDPCGVSAQFSVLFGC